jgi:hypothetical protein
VYGFGALESALVYAAIFIATTYIASSTGARAAIAAFLRRRARAASLALAIVAVVVVGGVLLSQRPDGRLRVTLRGAGAFIVTPSGRQALFAPDGGLLAAMGRGMPLWDKGVELMILPQRSDRARGNALPVAERYRIGAVIQPQGEDDPTAMLREWDAVARRQIGEVLDLPVGTRITLDPGVVLTIERRMEERIGARLTYGSTSIELIGDARAISGTLTNADVMFIGARGNTAPMLNAAHPRLLVWADAGGTEPRLADDITVLRLRELDELVLVSDGVSVAVEK